MRLPTRHEEDIGCVYHRSAAEAAKTSLGRTDKVIRAVALSVKSPEAVATWMGKLESATRARGIAMNALQLIIAEGIEIWRAAEDGLSRRKIRRTIEKAFGSEQRENKQTMSNEGKVAGTTVVRTVVANKPPGIMMQTIALVNGNSERVFNDSGADVSCISTSAAKRLGLRINASSMAVYNPNGVPFTCRGCATVTLQFGYRMFPFEFQVIDELDVGILIGDDFLRRYNCILSYGAGCIEYNGVPIETVHAERSKAVMKAYRSTEGAPVILRERTVPLPGKMQDVVATIDLPREFRLGTYSWVFEPLKMTEATFGVKIAPAIVKLEGISTTRVRIVGGLGTRQLAPMPAGTVLGTVHVVRSKTEKDMLRREVRIVRSEEAGHEDGMSSSQQTTDDEAEWERLKGPEFKRELQKILNQLPQELSTDERRLLEDVLMEYRRTLLPLKLGSTHVMTVDIDPGDAKPVCHRDRRWSPQETNAIKAQVEELLSAGLIEPSDSPWSNRLVCAPKKGADGTKSEIRVCVDFRDINSLCVKDAYPSPNIDATLDQLNKAKLYSSVDLAKGYHQVPLTDRAKQICSFRCPSGFFRYTRMPFGIMNAPAAFQRMMDVVLREISWKCCMVYIDDVIIYSTSWVDHIDHITNVLKRIRDAGLTVGLKKCHFGRKEVTFLGYIVSQDGIRPDPS